MTTEQMDDKDAQRAGFKDAADQRADGRGRWPFTPNPDDKVITEANGIRAWGMSGIPEIIVGDPSDEQLAAAQERGGRNGVLIIPEALRDQLFVTPEFHCEVCGSELHDALAHQTEEAYWVARQAETVTIEEHTHYTREARDQCAAGDHKYAELLDLAAEREKVLRDRLESPEWSDAVAAQTTMAEEPIENRLARAYENGLKQGLELGRHAYGNWDHR